MADKEMTDFLDGVVGVVEATSFEQLCLWRENHEERKMPWQGNAMGLLEVVGHISKMPICLNLTTAVVDGHKLVFIRPTSQVVDHRMIEKWLRDNLPKSAMTKMGYPNKVDAMNFHNVFPRT